MISLVSVIGFKVEPGQRPEILFGAKSVRYDEGARQWVFEIDNVPLDEGLTPPAGGLTLFYGLRESVRDVGRWSDEVDALGPDHYLHVVHVDVDVGPQHLGRIGEEDLAELTFVSVRRLRVPLARRVEEAMRCSGDGDLGSEVLFRPECVPNLFADPLFAHLQVFVYPISEVDRTKRLAFLRPGAKVVRLDQNQRKPWRAELALA